MALPERRHPAHLPPKERHNQAIVILLTVCTDRRKPVLADATAHACLLAAWQAHSAWLVGRYVILPDHVHLFCAPGSWPPPSLRDWVKRWKAQAARTWPQSHVGKLWQRDYWDRQLRRAEHYSRKWEYVRQNPVRAGLVSLAEQWPFQGEVTVFRWSD